LIDNTRQSSISLASQFIDPFFQNQLVVVLNRCEENSCAGLQLRKGHLSRSRKAHPTMHNLDSHFRTKREDFSGRNVAPEQAQVAGLVPGLYLRLHISQIDCGYEGKAARAGTVGTQLQGIL
jgi:hypothetical protein